jgi:MarR family transcriptional regulator, organic hydroperoxide resistance regulator
MSTNSFLKAEEFLKNEEFLISFNIALVCQRMHDEQAKILKRFDLTPRQALVLAYIINHPNDNVTPKVLEAHMRLSNPTVTVIIQSMTKKGLIRREKDPNDRRKYRLHPTEKALRMAELSRNSSLKADKAFYAGVTREEIEALRSILTKIMHNLEEFQEEHDQG